MSIFGSNGPVRSILSNRKTLVLEAPLVSKLGFYHQELPPGVSMEQAVAVIAQTPWALEAGRGVAAKLGLTGDDAEVAAAKWARALAEGMVRGMRPPPAVRPPRRGR